MAAPPWAEHAGKVVVEFKRGNNGRLGRTVQLTHSPHQVPFQLSGRIDPGTWANFMNELQQLALSHPYTARPSAGQCCSWLTGFACILVVGFGCCDPDGGDNHAWLQQLHAVTQRHQPAFGAAGAALSVQSVHGNYWVQVDLLQAAAYPQQQYPQQQAGAGKLAGPSSGEPGFYPHPAAYAPPPVPGAVMPPPRVEYTPDSKPQ